MSRMKLLAIETIYRIRHATETLPESTVFKDCVCPVCYARVGAGVLVPSGGTLARRIKKQSVQRLCPSDTVLSARLYLSIV